MEILTWFFLFVMILDCAEFVVSLMQRVGDRQFWPRKLGG
jgi:hypothetical protein